MRMPTIALLALAAALAAPGRAAEPLPGPPTAAAVDPAQLAAAEALVTASAFDEEVDIPRMTAQLERSIELMPIPAQSHNGKPITEAQRARIRAMMKVEFRTFFPVAARTYREATVEVMARSFPAASLREMAQGDADRRLREETGRLDGLVKSTANRLLAPSLDAFLLRFRDRLREILGGETIDPALLWPKFGTPG
jgi:hypothetical protein